MVELIEGIPVPRCWRAGTVSSYAQEVVDPCAQPPPHPPPPPALGPKVVFDAILPSTTVAEFDQMQQAVYLTVVQAALAGVASLAQMRRITPRWHVACGLHCVCGLLQLACMALYVICVPTLMRNGALTTHQRDHAGPNAVIPEITITAINKKSPTMATGIAIKTSVLYPEGTGALAKQFASRLSTGSNDWLTGAYPSATVLNASLSDTGSEPPMPPPSPPPPAPPPPAYIAPDPLPGTPSLPTDIQVQDIPPGWSVGSCGGYGAGNSCMC